VSCKSILHALAQRAGCEVLRASPGGQQEIQCRDECLTKAAALADRLTVPSRHIRARILIEQARQSYDRVPQTDDVTTMDVATALYWTGWQARQGEYIERDACFARADEVNPGITAALQPRIRAAPDTREAAYPAVNGESTVALPSPSAGK
jgi:hypothetical protein